MKCHILHTKLTRYFVCFNKNAGIVEQDGYSGAENINWYILGIQFGNKGPEA